MDRDEAKAIIESILFIADAPLAAERFAALFSGELSENEIAELLEELRDEYEERNLRISEVAEGWRVQTRPEFAQWLTLFFKMEKGQKLTRASLETLAIIAYRQPITRAEIDEIRGVDSGGVLRGLIDKTLVKTMGRRKVPGRPMMYGTTNRFLEYFGLARLTDLPTLEEFQSELGEGLPDITRQATIDFDVTTEEDETDEPATGAEPDTGMENNDAHEEHDEQEDENGGETETSPIETGDQEKTG